VLDAVKSGKWTLAGMGLSASVNLGVLEWTRAGASLNAVEVKVLDAATEGETQRGRTRRRWRWGSGGLGGEAAQVDAALSGPVTYIAPALSCIGSAPPYTALCTAFRAHLFFMRNG